MLHAIRYIEKDEALRELAMGSLHSQRRVSMSKILVWPRHCRDAGGQVFFALSHVMMDQYIVHRELLYGRLKLAIRSSDKHTVLGLMVLIEQIE